MIHTIVNDLPVLLDHDRKIANRSFENVAQFKYGNNRNKSKFDSGGN
jgi:hypothetical protein